MIVVTTTAIVTTTPTTIFPITLKHQQTPVKQRKMLMSVRRDMTAMDMPSPTVSPMELAETSPTTVAHAGILEKNTINWLPSPTN